MKKRKERNIDPSVYEDDSSDQDFNCAVIGGALKSLRRSHGKRQQEIAAILKVSVSPTRTMNVESESRIS